MGTCTCCGTSASKEVQNKCNDVMLDSDSFIGTLMKTYENQMIPEIKDIYNKCMLGQRNSVLIIEINNYQLGEIGAEILSRLLPELRLLKEMVLRKNEIGRNGASKLGNTLASVYNLERLCICDNNLYDEGIGYISCNIPFMNRLKDINFSKNELSNIGAEHIKDGIHNLDYIESIDLRQNAINNKGIFKLINVVSGFKHLKEFNFDTALLESSEIDLIKTIIPNLFKEENT